METDREIAERVVLQRYDYEREPGEKIVTTGRDLDMVAAGRGAGERKKCKHTREYMTEYRQACFEDAVFAMCGLFCLPKPCDQDQLDALLVKLRLAARKDGGD